jgi:hypothetical protein
MITIYMFYYDEDGNDCSDSYLFDGSYQMAVEQAKSWVGMLNEQGFIYDDWEVVNE